METINILSFILQTTVIKTKSLNGSLIMVLNGLKQKLMKMAKSLKAKLVSNIGRSMGGSGEAGRHCLLPKF